MNFVEPPNQRQRAREHSAEAADPLDVNDNDKDDDKKMIVISKFAKGVSESIIMCKDASVIYFTFICASNNIAECVNRQVRVRRYTCFYILGSIALSSCYLPSAQQHVEASSTLPETHC